MVKEVENNLRRSYSKKGFSTSRASFVIEKAQLKQITRFKNQVVKKLKKKLAFS
jgi:hypothetical protein